ALAFAREGARLKLIDRDAGGLEATAVAIGGIGATVATTVADLSTGQGVEAGLRAAFAGEEDRLDVLVNNVGIVDGHPFDELTDAHWERTFAVNFMSNIRVTRALLPRLRESGGVI